MIVIYGSNGRNLFATWEKIGPNVHTNVHINVHIRMFLLGCPWMSLNVHIKANLLGVFKMKRLFVLILLRHAGDKVATNSSRITWSDQRNFQRAFNLAPGVLFIQWAISFQWKPSLPAYVHLGYENLCEQIFYSNPGGFEAIPRFDAQDALIKACLTMALTSQ